MQLGQENPSEEVTMINDKAEQDVVQFSWHIKYNYEVSVHYKDFGREKEVYFQCNWWILNRK